MKSQSKLPPLLRDGSCDREVRHKKPKRQEKKVAKDLGGKRQPGSGSFSMHKGDVSRDNVGFPILVECKRTSGSSIRITLQQLIKITNEALSVNKFPALAIQFDEKVVKSVAIDRRESMSSEDWIAVPMMTFKAMLEALGEEGLGL